MGIINQPACNPIIGKTRTIPPAVPFTNANEAIQLPIAIWERTFYYIGKFKKIV